MSETPAGANNRVVLEFPTPEAATRFVNWMVDGGGECGFLDAEEINSWMISGDQIVRMTYAHALSHRGYDVKEHGPDRVVVCESDDSDS